jgi:hypothetical protein
MPLAWLGAFTARTVASAASATNAIFFGRASFSTLIRVLSTL